MKIIITIIVFLVIALIQLPVQIKNKQWKEVVVVSGLLTISLTLSILLSIGVKIPNPHEEITVLIELLVY